MIQKRAPSEENVCVIICNIKETETHFAHRNIVKLAECCWRRALLERLKISIDTRIKSRTLNGASDASTRWIAHHLILGLMNMNIISKIRSRFYMNAVSVIIALAPAAGRDLVPELMVSDQWVSLVH